VIKAVVCDLDGTLTDCDKLVGVNGIEALRRVQEKGITCMLASGNVLPIAYAVSTYVGMKGPVIAENGGIVSWKEEVHQTGDGEEPKRAYAHLRKCMPEAEPLFTDRWRVTEVALKRKVDPAEVKRILEDWPVKVETTGFAIHIMEIGHDKFVGVKKACELLGIDTEEVAAFGDSDNDVMMLSNCGVGISVGNGSPAVMQAADFVTQGRFADGVVEGLRYLGLL
jgi:phosphoglycolate phosphatase (TIGR01487 family)